MIQFPDQKLTSEKSLSETEKTYKEMYYLYKEGVFEEVVQKIDEMLPKIQNSILIPKFELLRAYSLGRVRGQGDVWESNGVCCASLWEFRRRKKSKKNCSTIKKSNTCLVTNNNKHKRQKLWIEM